MIAISDTMVGMKYELIGISGTFASGKDTLARHLEERFGYTHVSTGDLVREVAMRERGSVERPILAEVATRHREQDGAGYFVQQALLKSRPLIVSGIRSLGEMKALKAAGGVMLYVDAPVELRHQRIKERNRDAEVQLSLEEFIANEEHEMYGGDADTDFNIREIGRQADLHISNTGDLEAFLTDAHQLLELADS